MVFVNLEAKLKRLTLIFEQCQNRATLDLFKNCFLMLQLNFETLTKQGTGEDKRSKQLEHIDKQGVVKYLIKR